MTPIVSTGRAHVDTSWLIQQGFINSSPPVFGDSRGEVSIYDLDSELVSVISWDLNLAMQGSATPGPHDAISLGMGPEADVQAEAQPTASSDATPRAVIKNNSLKTRFLAASAFTDGYEAAYWSLYDEMYGSGAALNVLDAIVARVPLSDNFTGEDLQSAAAEMRNWIQERTSALAAVRKQ